MVKYSGALLHECSSQRILRLFRLYAVGVIACSVIDKAQSLKVESSVRDYDTDSVFCVLGDCLGKRGIMLEAPELSLEPAEGRFRCVPEVAETLLLVGGDVSMLETP